MAACIIRAIWSDAPPAPAATTISTGLFGSHAIAGGVASTIVSAAPAPMQIVLIILSSLNCTHGQRPAAALLVCWSCILPLCARGSRALAAVERAATLRRSFLPRAISPKGIAGSFACRLEANGECRGTHQLPLLGGSAARSFAGELFSA